MVTEVRDILERLCRLMCGNRLSLQQKNLRGYASDQRWRRSLLDCERVVREGEAIPHIRRRSRTEATCYDAPTRQPNTHTLSREAALEEDKAKQRRRS